MLRGGQTPCLTELHSKSHEPLPNHACWSRSRGTGVVQWSIKDRDLLIPVEKYLSCCTITGNISSEKSLAHGDYFHAEFPPLPAMLFSSHVGLFPIQQAFYISCYQGWILCVVFSGILGWIFFSPLSVLRSLDLAFTWDMTVLFYMCSILPIAWVLQAILHLPPY